MKYICILLSCLLSLNSYSQLNIITSVYPMKSIVSELAGDKGTVLNVIPPGKDPHHFEPTPQEVKKIAQADVFIGINHEFDGWIKRFLKKECVVVFMQKGHSHNEHIWLSPDDCNDLAEKVVGILKSTDLENNDYYEKQYSAFVKRMNAVGHTIKSMFSGLSSTTFIQYHPAWESFAEYTGLTIIGTIEKGHGKKISPKGLVSLIKKAKETGTRILVIGLRKSSREMDVIRDEVNGVIVELDALGSPDQDAVSDIFGLLKYNAGKLSEAMKIHE